MSIYPGAIPPAGTAVASDTLAAAGHTALHNTSYDEIRALATKLGTGASTAVASTVLRGTGAGTSSWAQVNLTSDVTGIIPTQNGGTGQSSLTGLTLPSATLSTPTIADFTNAQHDHSDADDGGVLGAGVVTSEMLKTTVAFHAYRSAAFDVTVSLAKINLDSELFDEGSDFDTTNSYFVAPVNGIYHFSGRCVGDASSRRMAVYIYVNGSARVVGGQPLDTFAAGVVSSTLKLAANDQVELWVQSDATDAADPGAEKIYLNGHLVGRY